MTAAAVFSSSGKFKIRRKSEPVPCGMIPSIASLDINRSSSKNPLTTSLMVPSPPTAMIVLAPFLIAFAVNSIPCPGAFVSSASTGSGRCARTFAQVSAVFPLADLGFRIATVVMRSSCLCSPSSKLLQIPDRVTKGLLRRARIQAQFFPRAGIVDVPEAISHFDRRIIERIFAAYYLIQPAQDGGAGSGPAFRQFHFRRLHTAEAFEYSEEFLQHHIVATDEIAASGNTGFHRRNECCGSIAHIDKVQPTRRHIRDFPV